MPSRIGRYLVLEELGAGGMGVVYAAYDPELDRKVAIKLMYAESDGGRARCNHAMLMREAQALAKLSHPNIVAIHDVGEYAGQPKVMKGEGEKRDIALTLVVASFELWKSCGYQ